jgi:hypothetical protein
MESQAHLLEVIEALQPPRGFAGVLHRGQQQGHQNSNDRDHDQQLN